MARASTKSLAGKAGAIGWALLVSACANAAPDTILINGKVFTASPAQPWAQAVAIHGDRIVAVGDSAAIAALAGSSTRRLDAGGRTIIPGINDAHQHVAIEPPHDVLPLPFDPTVEQIAGALRAQLETAPAGRLIRGAFSQTAWGDAAFARTWLDTIAPNHAVWLTAFTGHGALLNSKALERVGIDESIKDPDGGVFGRDGEARLNGRLEEYAQSIADQRLALETDASEVVRIYRDFAAGAMAWGITSSQLLGQALPIAEASKRLVEANIPLRIKVFRFPMREAGAETIDSRPPLPPQPSPFVDARGMKWILDGTPRERLGFLRAPYADSPGERGRLNLPPARIDEFVRWAYGSEDLLAVHAFGDASIDAYVSAIERAGRPEVWKQKRPRIEHGDMLSPDLIARVKAQGMVLVQNPAHFIARDVFLARLGAERVAWMQPLKSILKSGIPLAIGSDGATNPFVNILAASTHPTNPKEAITREEAVTAYTAGAAFAELKEKEKGTLAAGMLADLAVLSGDVFTAPGPELEGIKSVLTMIGGRIVHQTGAVR